LERIRQAKDSFADFSLVKDRKTGKGFKIVFLKPLPVFYKKAAKLFYLDFSHRNSINSFALDVETDARRFWRDNCSVRRDFDRRFDHVFAPVSFARRNVAGQGETFERGNGDVVRSADAGFKHSAAPDGNRIFAANLLD
jgi:hypothetical protein